MKKNNTLRLGFTLVELLVTLTIIMILALISVKGIKSMKKRTADVTCIAHLRDLAQGAMNYYSDFEHFPNAGSYETYSRLKDEYYEHRGWVGWIRKDGKESLRKTSAWSYGNGGNYYGASSHKSHASEYFYVGTGAEDETKEEHVIRSIREGSLFKYVKKNYSNYSCSLYNEGKTKKKFLRTYAMNVIFGGRTNKNGDLAEGSIKNLDFRDEHLGAINRSTMALFVEVEAISGTGTTAGTSGESGNASNSLDDDSIWDWEKLGAWHDIGGRPATHVAFLDGHVEAIVITNNKEEQIRNDLAKGLYKGQSFYYEKNK